MILFRFIILLLFALWLLRIVLAKVFVSPKKQPEPSQSPSNNMVKDPVCGMYMDSRLAVRLQQRKEAQYFCSEECKNKYLNKSGSAASSPPPSM